MVDEKKVSAIDPTAIPDPGWVAPKDPICECLERHGPRYEVWAIQAKEPGSVFERVVHVRDRIDLDYEVARWRRDYRDRYGRMATMRRVFLEARGR